MVSDALKQECDSIDDQPELSKATAARREELRRAHFAQYKAQVLTAYAEMKKRRIGASGALVAPSLNKG